MELGFILSALRRRWWLVVVCTVLGVLAGLQIKQSTKPYYEAKAVLSIQQPATVFGVQSNLDPDRYIQSQVESLNSLKTSELVAAQINGQTTDGVSRAIRIVQRTKTDIVDVFAKAPTAADAQQIANLYVQSYITDVTETNRKQKTPELAEIAGRLTKIQTRIGQLSQEINIKILPGATVIPPEVQPQVAERDLLVKQEDQLVGIQTQLELVTSLKVTTEIRQLAPLPTIPITGSKRQVLAGFLGGPLLGVALALLAARLSKKVIDAAQVEELLGQPVAARLPRIRALGGPRGELMKTLPGSAEGAIDLLCVRAEANASPTSALRVAVIGTERGAGVTTLAAAMAGKFARKGSTVVLVDADQNDPEISEVFRTTGDAGIPALLARIDRITDVKLTGVDRKRGQTHAGNRPIFTPLTPDVRVLGQGAKPGNPVLRRSNVAALLERLDNEAQVIVFDAGPLLDAATTVQIAAAVDAIVLAIPHRRQRLTSLEAVVRQLQTREGELLPVIVNSSRRRRTARATASEPTVSAASGSREASEQLALATTSGRRGSAARNLDPGLSGGAELNEATSPVVTYDD